MTARCRASPAILRDPTCCSRATQGQGDRAGAGKTSFPPRLQAESWLPAARGTLLTLSWGEAHLHTADCGLSKVNHLRKSKQTGGADSLGLTCHDPAAPLQAHCGWVYKYLRDQFPCTSVPFGPSSVTKAKAS